MAESRQPEWRGELRIKRIYDPPEGSDGFRVLVDRLWPRGMSHERARVDLWLKAVAPSPELRTWWNHDPTRLSEFARDYRAELDDNPAVAELHEVGRAHPHTTLLYAAHDPEVNHAQVLLSYLRALTD
ncbi:MAG: DUF488 family protein [Actinomycetota bacterium]